MASSLSFRWPQKMPSARLFEVVVNVRSNPEDPGRNVQFLKTLLQRLWVCFPDYEDLNPSGWNGSDVRLETYSPDRRKQDPYNLSSMVYLRILDYEGKAPWGGLSYNMLVLGFKDMKGQEGAEWLVGILKDNGYEDACYTCVLQDGTYDVHVPSLFVSCKFNILP